MTRPFSAACERNREPIAARLAEWLPAQGRVLEIGSGTGQHAVYFGACFPGGVYFLYGPVNRNGEFTSESNSAFDADLRARAEHMELGDTREQSQSGLQEIGAPFE